VPSPIRKTRLFKAGKRKPLRYPVSYTLHYHRNMAQRQKRSISLPPDLARAVDDAARTEGTTFSAWLAQTAAHRLKLEAGRQAIAEWELENDPLAPEELSSGRPGLAPALCLAGQVPRAPCRAYAA